MSTGHASAPTATGATYASLTSDDTVTGEAVALDLPPANLAHRMVSGLVDVLVTVVLVVAVGLLFLGASARGSGAVLHIAAVALVVTVFVIWPTVFETVTRGRSPGKMVMGLRTVRDDAGPISAQHAFVRALIGFVEIYAFSGGPAFLSAMLSERGKRLGDYAAGTYVVRDRVSLPVVSRTPMPAPLAAWAGQADIASLPSGLALAVRQHLQAAGRLDPRTRDRVAQDLATRVLTHVAPPPPPGTPPEALLLAVQAARRDRDAARLQREDQLRRRLTGRPG